MKSIFQKEVYKKEYSVSKKGRYIASINDFISEMKYNYNRSPYYIYPTKKLIDKITFYETDNFNKEFVKDDKVCINNNIYIIKDYIYDEKAITYIVYENEIIDDEESKQVTINKYIEVSNEYLLKEEEQKKNESKLNKKWWQFWR